MKTFGQLKKGDEIFVLLPAPKWGIGSYKIIEIKQNYPYLGSVYITVDNEFYTRAYEMCFFSDSGTVWADKEKAIRYLMWIAKDRRDHLVETIDRMISEYDNVENFIKEYDTTIKEPDKK